jgi:hypothetical protein
MANGERQGNYIKRYSEEIARKYARNIVSSKNF